MNKLGIDCMTATKGKIIAMLQPLATTIEVRDGGKYWEGPEYSQVFLDTTWTESELDDFLYNMNTDYVGTYERRE